jgi:hypothetical protein
MTLTVRMLPGTPFSTRVPKSNAKGFTGKGLVYSFDPPIIARDPDVKRQEFRVYTNVPEAVWSEYLAVPVDAEDAQAQRLAILGRFGASTTASSPFSVTEREFDSWLTVSGGRMPASYLLVSGIVAFEPKRASASTVEAIASSIDDVFALLGREVPAEADASQEESESESAPADAPAEKPHK